MNADRTKDRRCKLTDEQIAEIQKEYREGATQCALAEKYGVSRSTICYAVSPRSREKQRKLQAAWAARKNNRKTEGKQ